MEKVSEGCEILSLVPRGEGFEVLVGGAAYGRVKESAIREGVFVAYAGSSNVAFVGASPREAAISMLAKETWAVIEGPVMEAARRAKGDFAAILEMHPGLKELMVEEKAAA